MVGNCNKFHHVRSDDNCADILQLYSISLAQFAEWNPAVKSTCSNLWADTVSASHLKFPLDFFVQSFSRR